MIFRALALAGGLAGAAGTAQFPEYSQQYVQRLGGAVDALNQVVADFDKSAEAEGLTRIEAIAAMVGNSDDFVRRRGDDMVATIARSERLAADLELVANASTIQRATHFGKFLDNEVARQTLDDFKPALPLTLEGLWFALVGFFGGWAGFSVMLSIFSWPFGRRRRA